MNATSLTNGQRTNRFRHTMFENRKKTETAKTEEEREEQMAI